MCPIVYSPLRTLVFFLLLLPLSDRLLRAGESGAADGTGGGGGGRVFLFGDSSCVDDAALGRLKSTHDGGVGDCLWLFKSAVRFACEVWYGDGMVMV